MENLVHQLDNSDKSARLKLLKDIFEQARKQGDLPRNTQEVNNHVHTRFSFSPYYPAQAAYQAWYSGLQAVGIMDHDSVGGAAEMIEACRILGIGSTVGCELRVNADGTRLEGRRINSPDSNNLFYMAIHGISKKHIAQVSDFIKPITDQRMKRNRKQLEKLNIILEQCHLPALNFDLDILPLSLYDQGGSVTERHILYALALKSIALWGKGPALVQGLKDFFKIELNQRLLEFLSDVENPHLEYDLLGVFKSNLLPDFFIQPDSSECINVREVVAFAKEIQAIPAYAYLGDIDDSPTGDKKSAQFEDSYLSLLIDELKIIGFQAVTYMPPRNTKEQLLRVSRMCREANLMEISGVDINSSRQSFLCPEILDPQYRHLVDSTWALIAHEKLVDSEPSWGLFHPDNVHSALALTERIKLYKNYGEAIDPFTLRIMSHPPDGVKK